MAISADFVLNQAIVEVQYNRGSLYFDKCGSLLLSLEDALGKPFVGTVPNMDHGELNSAAERLVVTYSSKSFNTTQGWVDAPARVEHVAPTGWELVAETLGVGRAVSRCGVRYLFVWKVDSLTEGQAALANCRVFSVSPEWRSTLGDVVQAWAIVIEDQRGKMRVALDAVEIPQNPLPADLVGVVPKCAIVLDFDHVYPGGSTPFALPRGTLKDFIRSAWQRSKVAATVVRTQLGADRGG